MWKQVRLLTGVFLCNLLGWNQMKYGRDRKKKNRLLLLLFTFALLGLMIAVYSGTLSYGMISMGMGDMVPAYVLTTVSLIILFFTMFKAGSILFEYRSYEMLISLPVSSAAIVVSRFLSMYVQNVVMGLLLMLPAAGVYAAMLRPSVWFYLTMLLGSLLMPLLPMTAATALGAGITALSARMKHKNLVAITLTLLLTMGFLVGSTMMSMNAEDMPSQEIMISEDSLRNLGAIMQEQLYRMYPPARLFTVGVVEGDAAAFLGFAAASLGGFALLAALVQWKFAAICAALNARAAKGNYQLQTLNQASVLKALYKKELSRYFASTLYVVNTLISYLLMVLLALAVLFAGSTAVEQVFGIPGILKAAMPLLLAAICSMMPTTLSSISMEGKQWWLTQSLPVTSGQLFDGKLLVNLTVALPCYGIAQLLLIPALELSLPERVWVLTVPLAYLFFASVMGITINCRMPMFQWENEAAVVKQSGSVLLGMLLGILSIVPPAAAVFLLGGQMRNLVFGAATVLVSAAALYLHHRNKKIDLRTIY